MAHGVKGHATAQLEIPSKVTDRKFLRMPQEEKVVESDDEWSKCGKWILSSFDLDLNFVDKAWTDLQPLLIDGTLIMLKASTVLMKSEGAHIRCFTRPGKENAKRAAEAIRKIVDYRGVMYYKVNYLTEAGRGKGYDDHSVTIYMHTFMGRFYEHFINGWILDSDDSDKKKVLPSNQFNRKNYLGREELPSKSAKGCVHDVSRQPETARSAAYWLLRCSYLEEDMFLAEADRAWIVAKKLYNEGYFVSLSYFKDETAVAIRMYLEDADVFSQLKCCDRIFKEASVGGVMYFCRGNKIKLSYKYTAEGELYEHSKFTGTEKFVLQTELV